MVKIDEANENEYESNVSPTLGAERLGGTIKDINKRQGLEQIDEKFQGQDKDDDGFRDSVQSLPVQEVNKGGELYNRLWGSTEFPAR